MNTIKFYYSLFLGILCSICYVSASEVVVGTDTSQVNRINLRTIAAKCNPAQQATSVKKVDPTKSKEEALEKNPKETPLVEEIAKLVGFPSKPQQTVFIGKSVFGRMVINVVNGGRPSLAYLVGECALFPRIKRPIAEGYEHKDTLIFPRSKPVAPNTRIQLTIEFAKKQQEEEEQARRKEIRIEHAKYLREKLKDKVRDIQTSQSEDSSNNGCIIS